MVSVCSILTLRFWFPNLHPSIRETYPHSHSQSCRTAGLSLQAFTSKLTTWPEADQSTCFTLKGRSQNEVNKKEAGKASWVPTLKVICQLSHSVTEIGVERGREGYPTRYSSKQKNKNKQTNNRTRNYYLLKQNQCK